MAGLDPVSAVGFAAAALTSTAYAPQVVRAWRTRKVDDVSPLMVAGLGAGMALWMAYGLLRGDVVVVVVANVVGLSLTAALGALWLRWRRRG